MVRKVCRGGGGGGGARTGRLCPVDSRKIEKIFSQPKGPFQKIWSFRY